MVQILTVPPRRPDSARGPLLLVAVAVGLLLAAGCSTPPAGDYISRCSISRDIVDGGGNAQVGDHVAYLGRGVIVHLDAIDESVAGDGVAIGTSGAGRTVTGSRKDARVLSVSADYVELGVSNPEMAGYLANSHLCRS